MSVTHGQAKGCKEIPDVQLMLNDSFGLEISSPPAIGHAFHREGFCNPAVNSEIPALLMWTNLRLLEPN